MPLEIGGKDYGAVTEDYSTKLYEVGDSLSAHTQLDVGGQVQFTRAMRNPIGTVIFPARQILSGLGVSLDNSSRALRAINIAVHLDAGMMGMYVVARATVLTQTARETTLAAIETAIQAALQNWGGIALAATAAASVAAGFAVGSMHIGGGDMSNPTIRRTSFSEMKYAVREGS